MPESSLTLDLHALQAEVGDFAGYGFGEKFADKKWTVQQQARIDRSVDSGVRWVYFTEEMEGVPARYEWSWLKPVSKIALPTGATSVRLPDDFNGLLADVIPASAAGEIQFPIAVVGYGELYRARAAGPVSVGRPIMAYQQAIKGTTQQRSNRYTLEIWPTADADYTLLIQYEIAPDALTEALPFVYGGPSLAEVFKAAVRGAYELYYNAVGKDGPEQVNFRSKLRAAIAGDRKFKPLTIGQNSDRSDDPIRYLNQRHGYWGVPLELNGVTYP